jgi:hypothetical protein
MDEKTQKIITLIKQSALDQTIQDILVRDLESEGLTDFLREQIKAYCVDSNKKLDEQEAEAIKLLEEKYQNPSV